MALPSSLLDQDNNERSDTDLVTASIAGDRNAFRAIVERYQGRLFRVALGLIKNRSDAEDIVQESFVKAFLSLGSFKQQGSLYSWLHRITFNMALDQKRRNLSRGGEHFEYLESANVYSKGDSHEPQKDDESARAFFHEESAAANAIDPQTALLKREAIQRFAAAMEKLSDEHRAVVTLREIDGLDYDQIAQALGVPRGTVMSRLYYARRALQEALS
jgi:RNA polymerase sigma-70 factor (ECF subfamily)